MIEEILQARRRRQLTRFSIKWLSLHEAKCGRPSGLGLRLFTTSPSPRTSTMASTSTSQQPKGRGGALLALAVLIRALTLAKDVCGVPPAQIALGSAVVLLTMINVRFLPTQPFVIVNT